MLQKLILLILAIPSLIFSDVTDYLKPALNKGKDHTIRNIDFIYMINLDQRPEKFERSTKELAFYGVHPYRFSAVNGWELSMEVLNNLGVKYAKGMKKNLWGTCYLPEDNGRGHHEIMQVQGRNYFAHWMSRGAIGIVLSHLSILQDALNSGYKTIWVMEDDVEVIQNPNMISIMIDKLDATVGKDKWDILFTDQDTKNTQGEYVPCRGYARKPNYDPKDTGRFAHREDVGKNFRKVGARYGAYSMIIRRAGMKKILSFINTYKIFLPYDMEYCLSDKMRMYVVKDDIVSTFIDASSDNSAPNYQIENKP